MVCRPLRGLTGFLEATQGSALPRSTLGFMLPPAPQAEERLWNLRKYQLAITTG